MNSLLRRRMMIQERGGGGRLPAGLQEVEYLESTGMQYIDTLWIPYQYNQLNYFRIDFACPVENGAFKGNRTPCWLINNPDNSQCYGVTDYMGFTAGNGAIGLGVMRSIYVDERKYSFVFNHNDLYMYMNDVYVNRINWNPGAQMPQYKMRLFANFTADQRGSLRPCVRIYYTSMGSAEDSLDREFVPCRVTSAGWTDEEGNEVSAGTRGMYDLVNGVLYTNRGSGADFIAGPDII